MIPLNNPSSPLENGYFLGEGKQEVAGVADQFVESGRVWLSPTAACSTQTDGNRFPSRQPDWFSAHPWILPAATADKSDDSADEQPAAYLDKPALPSAVSSAVTTAITTTFTSGKSAC